MGLISENRTRLWRYNYRILIGTGYWLLVLPVAASQIVTLWMFAMASGFNQTVATQIAELMTPVLGAFLVAHSMAPEYRGGVGAVLACKPVSLHRVVTMRAGLAMMAAVVLTTITLGVCSVGLQPIDVARPVLAALPSLWFLSLVALTFATLFRNALSGFAVAAALWAVDLGLGYSVHPLLSLQGLAAKEAQDQLALLWPYSKIALTVVGTIFLFVHGRLLRRLYQVADRGNVLRIVTSTAVVLFAYCATGAMAVVGYGWLHRGHLSVPDVVWYQRQLKAYGPVPVVQLFGPAFATYVAQPPSTQSGDDKSGAAPGGVRSWRTERLEQALKRWPHSIWADGIAFSLGRETESTDPPGAATAYFRVVDAYATSPFAPLALTQIIRMEEGVPDEVRLRAAHRVLAEYPRDPMVDAAAALLSEKYPAQVKPDEMAEAAAVAAKGGAAARRPLWLMIVAELRAEQHRNADAIAAAREARTAGQALQAELARSGGDADRNLVRFRPQINEAIRQADALLRKLGAG